jgi:short-subunit dehydrogenase
MSGQSYRERYGEWALIAGGSDGIGAAFANELARRGFNLVLLARREDVLADCAASIRNDHPVEVRTLCADLTAPDLTDAVDRAVSDLEVGMLIYNAGSPTAMGRFLDQPVEAALQLVALNCTGPITLAHMLGGEMRKRGRGGMIFMTSVAGLAGSAYQVAYSATKSFDQVFAEALWQDLYAAGVDVLSLVAGATRTPSVARMGLDFDRLAAENPAAAAMNPEDVAREGLDQLGRGPLWVAGEGNRELLPFLFSPGRANAINALSAGVAAVHGFEHIVAGQRSYAVGET